MTTDRDACPALGRVLVVAAVLLSFLPLAVSAQSARPLQPVKRAPGATPTPFVAAQIQIAKLRQAADQLRLLARAPLPANVTDGERAEHTRHVEWLRGAEHRVTVLADTWEQRLQPLAGSAAEIARALDLNAFFEAQAAGLQSKLRRETSGSNFESEPVRAANDTAKVVINQIN